MEINGGHPQNRRLSECSKHAASLLFPEELLVAVGQLLTLLNHKWGSLITSNFSGSVGQLTVAAVKRLLDFRSAVAPAAGCV